MTVVSWTSSPMILKWQFHLCETEGRSSENLLVEAKQNLILYLLVIEQIPVYFKMRLSAQLPQKISSRKLKRLQRYLKI